MGRCRCPTFKRPGEFVSSYTMRLSMHWNPFLLVPRELILAVCEELDLTDLKHMRLTCKALANGLVPLVLSHIIISGKGAKTTIEELVSKLQFLTKPEGAAVNCSREITFNAIFRDSEIDEQNDNVALDHESRISEEFFAALTSFKIVQTVNWHTGHNDPLWLQENIWKAIGVFPNLRHLKIDSSFLKQPLGNFDSLKALESVNISGYSSNDNESLFLGLSKLYASSSKLNSITIKNPKQCDDEEPSDAYTLQHLFSSSPTVQRLRRLAISHVNVRLDEVTLSHLAHLTSFKLGYLPYAPSLNSSPDDIWVAFRRSKICLEELDIGFEAMADSLNDYLSSFSGLKKLKLTIPGFGSQASSEASAIRFWSESLPNHTDTMQDFSLRAYYNGQWCFGRHNLSLIAKCTKLEQLTVSLLPEDIPRKASDYNCVNALVDTVVAHMPHIKQFGMDVPSRKSSPAPRGCCPHPLLRMARDKIRVARDKHRLMDWVPKYKPPASCQSLPPLAVSDRHSESVRVFVGIKNVRRSRLKYILSKEHESS